MKTALLLVAACLAGVPRGASAQIAPPSGQAPPPAPAAVQSCVGCHGPHGAGVTAGDVPRIAGLSQYYITKQLRSYATGTRQNPVMEAIANGMSAQEVARAAAYFAQVNAPAVRGAQPAAPRGSTERGRTLATTGSEQLRVQACNNCHGPAGVGAPPAIPYLAGQGATYLIATLNAWRSGIRRNDEGEQMAVIARALTPDAIVAVARHFSSLQPPPAPLELVEWPAPRQLPAPSRIPAENLATADPARGRAILASGVHGCAGCHTIPGIRGANGIVGPPLGGMAHRGFIAGQLPNRPGVLVAFLQDPPSLVPRTGMPATGLTREEARQIAAYLYTLGR